MKLLSGSLACVLTPEVSLVFIRIVLKPQMCLTLFNTLFDFHCDYYKWQFFFYCLVGLLRIVTQDKVKLYI